MNTSAPPLSGSFAHTRSGPPPLSWPTPPFPSYAETPAPPEGWACRVEGSNGQVRPCVLVALDVLEFVTVVVATAALYRYVPNAQVRWGHALAGGLFVSLALESAKKLLAWYLATAAVVSAYGAAGSLVVLLMWIYFSSAVLLFSASCARAFQELGALPAARGRLHVPQ